MLPVERLDAIIARAEALQEEMNAELPPERFVELSKEYAEIDPLVAAIKTYRAALAEREELWVWLPAMTPKWPNLQALSWLSLRRNCRRWSRRWKFSFAA